MPLSPQSVQWSGFTMRTILGLGYEKAALSMEQGLQNIKSSYISSTEFMTIQCFANKQKTPFLDSMIKQTAILFIPDLSNLFY